MTDPIFSPPLVRATLATAILTCLERGDAHGYGLAQQLADMGFGTLKGGSLYPALSKLEEAGAVTRYWSEGRSGPARREYTLTEAGREQLRQQRQELSALAQALSTSQPSHQSV